MNELLARKELLLAQSELHRQLLAAEWEQCRQRSGAARALVGRSRWLLLGGLVLGGVLVARRWRSVVVWLPTVLTTLRALRR